MLYELIPFAAVSLTTSADFVGIGTTSPGSKLEVHGEVKSVVGSTEFYMVPKGGIIIWSGAQAAIPTGWALCNGSNGTPDLRDRFIVGAGNEYSVNQSGGEKNHTLTTDEMPSHSHVGARNWATVEGTGSTVFRWGDPAGTYNTADTYTAGGGQAHENRPPYYALCYIMKI